LCIGLDVTRTKRVSSRRFLPRLPQFSSLKNSPQDTGVISPLVDILDDRVMHMMAFPRNRY